MSTTAATSKYASLLLMSDKEKSESQVSFQSEESHLGLQKRILENRKEISRLKGEIEREKGKYPLNPSNVISLQTDLEAAEEGLKRLQDLEKELFTEGASAK